jgi:hypothetical protein
MIIRLTRPIITSKGVTDIEYTFDTETLELAFNPKDTNLLLALYLGKDTKDIPELTKYEVQE